MKNAHLRFGWLLYVKSTEKTTTSIKLHLDRFIGELLPDLPRQAKAHFISVIGGDTQISAISAAISLGDRFMVEGPGIPPTRVMSRAECSIFQGIHTASGTKEAIAPPYRLVGGVRLSKQVGNFGKDAASKFGQRICLGIHRGHLRNTRDSGMGRLV